MATAKLSIDRSGVSGPSGTRRVTVTVTRSGVVISTPRVAVIMPLP